jgi:hypothetical protein
MGTHVEKVSTDSIMESVRFIQSKLDTLVEDIDKSGEDRKKMIHLGRHLVINQLAAEELHTDVRGAVKLYRKLLDRIIKDSENQDLFAFTSAYGNTAGELKVVKMASLTTKIMIRRMQRITKNLDQELLYGA